MLVQDVLVRLEQCHWVRDASKSTDEHHVYRRDGNQDPVIIRGRLSERLPRPWAENTISDACRRPY